MKFTHSCLKAWPAALKLSVNVKYISSYYNKEYKSAFNIKKFDQGLCDNRLRQWAERFGSDAVEDIDRFHDEE